jgi:hypothetical protein
MKGLRKASFGRTLEEALPNLTTQAFLKLTKTPEQTDHTLGIEGIFGLPALLRKLTDDEIILCRDGLHEVETPLLPLRLLKVPSIGKPQRNHKIDDQ